MPAVDDWVIETEDLTAGYGAGLILDGVTVRVPRGRLTCVIGGSGSGKSTFLKCVVGLLPPLRGRVRVLGQDPYALDDEERSALLSRVGLLFQDGALLNSLSLRENLEIPFKAHTNLPGGVVDEAIRTKLGLVALGGALGKLPGELSGGMRKRAGLARALALDPELLLCDEPSAGLDPLTAANLDRLIRHLQEVLRMTVLVVTHELPSIKLIADHIIMLRDKRVYYDGPAQEAYESRDPVLTGFFGRVATADEARGRSLLDVLAVRS
ncbi:MAG: ABC transporter [Myxococcales bacterium]